MPFITFLQLLLYVLTCINSLHKFTRVVTWAEHDQTVFMTLGRKWFCCLCATLPKSYQVASVRLCMVHTQHSLYDVVHLDEICSRQLIWNDTTSEDNAVSHACRCFSDCICTKVPQFNLTLWSSNVVPIPPASFVLHVQSSTLQCVITLALGCETREQQLHNITRSLTVLYYFGQVKVKQCSHFWSVVYIGYTTLRGGS